MRFGVAKEGGGLCVIAPENTTVAAWCRIAQIYSKSVPFARRNKNEG
jgi:hypothetical protein